MRPLPYSLQFRGYAEDLAARVLRFRATAPGCCFVTTVAEDGLSGRFEWLESEDAALESRVAVAADGSFDAAGAVTIGGGHVLRFQTVGSGRLNETPQPELRQGAAVLEVTGGKGQFERASGRIASTFILSDTGELTDNHAGLLFVAGDRGSDPHRVFGPSRDEGRDMCGRRDERDQRNADLLPADPT